MTMEAKADDTILLNRLDPVVPRGIKRWLFCCYRRPPPPQRRRSKRKDSKVRFLEPSRINQVAPLHSIRELSWDSYSSLTSGEFDDAVESFVQETLSRVISSWLAPADQHQETRQDVKYTCN